MKKILSISILALLLGALITSSTISTQVYDVRVTVRNGNCSTTKVYSVEARSTMDARQKAASAALNSTRVTINGISIKR